MNGTSTSSTSDPIALVLALERAVEQQDWILIVSTILMLAVVAIRVFDVAKKIPPEYVPWLTIGLASTTSIAVGLQAGIAPVKTVTTGILVGVAAIGGWESFGKLIRGLIRQWPGRGGTGL